MTRRRRRRVAEELVPVGELARRLSRSRLGTTEDAGCAGWRGRCAVLGAAVGGAVAAAASREV
jgi:hypothetical protein